MLISLVVAGSPLGTFKQGERINLIQTCATCTYNNITTIQLGNGTLITLNSLMEKDGSFFNLTLSPQQTVALGDYKINGIGDLEGVNTIWTYSLQVTPSGNSGSDNIVFFIFIIVLLYAITFAGFFGKNIPLTILGGMAMMFLGLYLVKNGIIIYRDDLTNYVSYVTIAVGAMCSIWAGLEQFEVI